MNVGALTAVGIFAAAFMSIFGFLYLGASASHKRGELGWDGVRLLRWAAAGHLTIFALLALASFFI